MIIIKASDLIHVEEDTRVIEELTARFDEYIREAEASGDIKKLEAVEVLGAIHTTETEYIFYIGLPNVSIVCERLPINTPVFVLMFIQSKWETVYDQLMEAFRIEAHARLCPHCNPKSKVSKKSQEWDGTFIQRTKEGIQ